MSAMARRRRLRRRRRTEGAAVLRVAAMIARVVLVVLVSVVVGYAFYIALQWVASEAESRRSSSTLRTPPAAFVREGQ